MTSSRHIAPLSIEPMTPEDLRRVSALGIASKASWGYDAAEMRVFARELTITSADLDEFLAARIALIEGEIVGYFTIREHADGVTELEHLFVAEGRFRCGVGTELLRRALHDAHASGIQKLTIIADPDSAGFYERFGARKTGVHQSSIPGRSIPIYEMSPGTAKLETPITAAMRTKILSGPATAESVDLSASSFDDVNLGKASFRNVSLKGAAFEDVAFTGATIRNACLGDLTIEGASYAGMRIEGILVTELLDLYRASHEKPNGPDPGV